jgi:tRNA pseudouridine55 synthase
MDGILNVNKPAGITSYDVVAKIKRLSGERRVGHAGTLDPAATGVLPVCLGRATRVVEFIMGSPKTYLAVIELGVNTDTYDASGTVTSRSDYSCVSRKLVETALDSFRGDIQQAPPMYSALKYGGRPLYELAREGRNIERPSRIVSIQSLAVIEWEPPRFTLEVTCGRGTYIRSLAHDLGQALGCGAHLVSLARTRYGPFDIRAAVALPQLESGDWQHFLYPADFVLQDLPAVTLNDTRVAAMKNGQILDLGGISPAGAELCRAYAEDGRLLGILRRLNEEKWQPEKVLG